MREIKIKVQDEFALASDNFAGVQGAGNASAVVIEFDESWKSYRKEAFWISALGTSSARVLLGAHNQVAEKSDAYRVLVPFEALCQCGSCTLIIEGFGEASRARSVSLPFYVASAPDTEGADTPKSVTPPEREQLRREMQELSGRALEHIQKLEEHTERLQRQVAQNSDAIEKMPEFPAYVGLNVQDGALCITFKEENK